MNVVLQKEQDIQECRKIRVSSTSNSVMCFRVHENAVPSTSLETRNSDFDGWSKEGLKLFFRQILQKKYSGFQNFSLCLPSEGPPIKNFLSLCYTTCLLPELER